MFMTTSRSIYGCKSFVICQFFCSTRQERAPSFYSRVLSVFSFCTPTCVWRILCFYYFSGALGLILWPVFTCERPKPVCWRFVIQPQNVGAKAWWSWLYFYVCVFLGLEQGMEEKGDWKNRWQAQLSELKKRSMSKDARGDLSWGARMRRRRDEMK